MQGQPLVVADVGNSFTKLARFKDGGSAAPEQRSVVALNDADEAACRRLFASFWLRSGVAVAVACRASVNPAAAHHLAAVAASCGGLAAPLPKRPVRRNGSGYRLEELGIDRLAAIEGWLSTLTTNERNCGGAAVIVSVGTALTIDFVRADGEHLGGLIAPGLSTALSSLHAGAALLPAVSAAEFLDVADGPAHDTAGAMRGGALQMLAGLSWNVPLAG